MARIEGMDNFMNFVGSISSEVEEEVKKHIKETALRTELNAKQLTPVDTGTLRRSINTKLENGGLTALVGTNMEYSMAVEYGTSKQPAQPYMTPAYVKNKQKFMDGMERILREAGN